MGNSHERIKAQLEWQSNPHAQLSVIQRLQKQMLDIQAQLTQVASKVKGAATPETLQGEPHALSDFHLDLLEDFQCAIARLKKLHPDRRFFTLKEIDKDLVQIAFENNLSKRTLLSLLKRLDCQHRTMQCRWYGIPDEIKRYKANSQ